MKKLTFLLFSLILTLSLCLVACGDNSITGSDGALQIEYRLSNDKSYASVVGYKGNGTEAVIADSYKGVPVTYIGVEAFSDSHITSVTIPTSVTIIGERAFSQCKSLTSVEISEGVTKIGASAFSNCDSLVSIELPDSVTIIGESLFSNCDILESVILYREVL